MYNLRPDPLGFLPVPVFGSFFFFLPSFILPDTKSNTFCFSYGLSIPGINLSNLSSETWDAFLAAVPDTPPDVTIVLSSRLGY